MASSSVTASSVTGWHAFVLGVALLAPFSVFAGELLPYSPPTVVAGTTNSVPEEVYQRFRNDVKSLSAAQRRQLDATLEQNRASASAQGNRPGEQHYRRLLDILRST
jgi:hypothetical protein